MVVEILQEVPLIKDLMVVMNHQTQVVQVEVQVVLVVMALTDLVVQV